MPPAWWTRCCGSARSTSSATCRAIFHCNGDALRLTQVFVNLLANASKFAPEATAIRVGARRETDKIIAWVEDAGPGLPDGAQEVGVRAL